MNAASTSTVRELVLVQTLGHIIPHKAALLKPIAIAAVMMLL
jgi:hypothetical protein